MASNNEKDSGHGGSNRGQFDSDTAREAGKSRMGAAVRALMIIWEVLLPQPEAAHPSSMPRLAAKATRIRGGRVLNRSLEDLIRPAAAPLNNMLKLARKVMKTAMAVEVTTEIRIKAARTSLVLPAAALPSSMPRRAAKAIKIPDKKHIK